MAIYHLSSGGQDFELKVIAGPRALLTLPGLFQLLGAPGWCSSLGAAETQSLPPPSRGFLPCLSECLCVCSSYKDTSH